MGQYLKYSGGMIFWLRAWAIPRGFCWFSVIVILSAIAQAGCTSCFSPEARLPEYIQIREMKLAAGTETHHAWRILQNGQLEAASWNNQGGLLKWSEATRVPNLFARFQQAVLDTEPPKPSKPSGTIALGRSAYAVTVSRTVDERTASTFLRDVPDSIARLVADLHTLDTAMTVPAPGRYLWVEPDRRPADRARNLNGVRACAAPEGRALAQAIASGSLVTPLREAENLSANLPPLGQVLSVKARSGWYLIAHVEVYR